MFRFLKLEKNFFFNLMWGYCSMIELVNIYEFLLFTSSLFLISLVGMFLNKENILVLLMCLELLLLSVSTNFLVFSYFIHRIEGTLVVLFVLAVAAVEISIGLAILIKIYKRDKIVSVAKLNSLKG